MAPCKQTCVLKVCSHVSMCKGSWHKQNEVHCPLIEGKIVHLV